MTDSFNNSSQGERLSISLTGGEADYLREYTNRNPDHGSAAKIVGNGLSIIKLIESLEPGQRLAVVDTGSGEVTPIHIPWAPPSEHMKLEGF